MPADGKGMVDDFPATNVTINEAIAYAELVGKIIPEEAQYECAATQFGKTNFPWGDEVRPGPWRLGPVGHPDYDVLDLTPAVRGLFSGMQWNGRQAGEFLTSNVPVYP